MNAKLHNLNELSKLLEDKDAVSRELLSLSGKFQLGRIAREAGFKKEKGDSIQYAPGLSSAHQNMRDKRIPFLQVQFLWSVGQHHRQELLLSLHQQ